MAKHIHSHSPPSVNQDRENGYTHRNIVFAGGLGELWDWECEGISEAVNDVNKELTNFWNVLAHPQESRAFRETMDHTPLSEELFDWAKRKAGVDGDPYTRAIAFFIRFRQSRQGLGKDYATPTRRTRRGMNENVSAWLSAVEGLPAAHERLKRVEIRNLDFAEFIRKYDHPKAFFYCDPPYLHETRHGKGDNGEYEHEMTVGDHSRLLCILDAIEGRFMLSGYLSMLYGQWAWKHGWRRIDVALPNSASSKKTKTKMTECLWLNY